MQPVRCRSRQHRCRGAARDREVSPGSAITRLWKIIPRNIDDFDILFRPHNRSHKLASVPKGAPSGGRSMCPPSWARLLLSATAAAGFAKSDQSCSPGDKVTGIGSNGEILHAPDVDINTDTIKVNSGHAELFIRAKYSFIDSWNNELAYLKVDDNIVWSKTCIYQTDGMTAASRTYAILLATPTTGCTSRQWFHTRVTPRTSPSGRIWPAVIPSPSEFQTSKSGNRTS